MTQLDLNQIFGGVAELNATEDILSMLKSTSYSEPLERKKIASYALISVACQSSAPQSYFEDAIQLLDDLSQTKSKIDMSVSHQTCITDVTSRLLLRAQQFTEENTVPCNEWPSTEEIALELIKEWQRILNNEKQRPINPPFVLLRNQLQSHDALIARVTDLGQGEYLGSVEKVYSRRFEGPEQYASGPLKFVGSTGSWGNATLVNGERALIFVSYLTHSERYYQSHWHGHFSLKELDGKLHAIANWHLLEHGPNAWCPEALAKSAFLIDPDRPWQVAMPFDLLEAHLLDELSHIPPTSSKIHSSTTPARKLNQPLPTTPKPSLIKRWFGRSE